MRVAYMEMSKLIIFDVFTFRKSISYQTVLTASSSSARCVCSTRAYLACILSFCSSPPPPYLVRYAIGNSVLSNDIYSAGWLLGWQMLSVSALNRFRSIQLVLHIHKTGTSVLDRYAPYNDKL